jgi:amino acid permease
MRGSIFALCSGAIGTGVLSLPYVLAINGWVVGIIMIIMGAFGKPFLMLKLIFFLASGMSCYLLADAAGKIKENTYSKVAEVVGGNKLKLFLEFNFLFYTLGSCISYHIISKQNL